MVPCPVLLLLLVCGLCVPCTRRSSSELGPPPLFLSSPNSQFNHPAKTDALAWRPPEDPISTSAVSAQEKPFLHGHRSSGLTVLHQPHITYLNHNTADDKQEGKGVIHELQLHIGHLSQDTRCLTRSYSTDGFKRLQLAPRPSPKTPSLSMSLSPETDHSGCVPA